MQVAVYKDVLGGRDGAWQDWDAMQDAEGVLHSVTTEIAWWVIEPH